MGRLDKLGGRGREIGGRDGGGGRLGFVYEQEGSGEGDGRGAGRGAGYFNMCAETINPQRGQT